MRFFGVRPEPVVRVSRPEPVEEAAVPAGAFVEPEPEVAAVVAEEDVREEVETPEEISVPEVPWLPVKEEEASVEEDRHFHFSEPVAESDNSAALREAKANAISMLKSPADPERAKAWAALAMMIQDIEHRETFGVTDYLGTSEE